MRIQRVNSKSTSTSNKTPYPIRKDGCIKLPWYDHFVFMATKANGGKGWGVILSGPSSSGKTFAAYMLARDLGYELVVQQGHRRIEIEELRGTRSIVAGKGGMPVTGFDPGTITRALQLCSQKGVKGVVFDFDEINLVDPGMLGAINNLNQMDENSVWVVPELQTTYKRPSNFIFVGTMNPEYAAVNPLSEAFMSRIVVIECPMMDIQAVRTILSLKFKGCQDMVDATARAMNYIETARRNEQHHWEPDLRTMIQFLDAWHREQPNWKKGTSLNTMASVFDAIIGAKIGWRETVMPARKGLRDSIVVSLGGENQRDLINDLMITDIDGTELPELTDEELGI